MDVGEVRALSFDDRNVAQVSFSELSGAEEFALLLFAANKQPASYPVQIQALSLSGEKSLQLLHSDPPEADVEADPKETTSRFHETLRERESNLLGLEPYSPGEDVESDKALATGSSCAGGAGAYLKVLTSLTDTDQYTTACAVTVRTTSQAIYYVDQSIQGNLPASVLNPFIDAFEQKLPLEKALLGTESDVDENGKIAVFFTPAVNRLGAASGGFVTGFFYGGDLFPTENNPASNQGEILYSCVPDSNGAFGVPLSVDFWASNIAPSVLPHEFQHMVSFNQKVLQQGVSPEEPWLNEGISHFLEDLAAVPGVSPDNFGADNLQALFGQAGKENPSRVELYLAAPELNPFTAGVSLAQRGGSYLALKYLYEQANLGRYPGVANGQELLKKLLSNSQHGIDNLEITTGWTWSDLLLDFFAAVELSSVGLDANPRYRFHGICLHCDQDDNRGTKLEGVNNISLENTSGSGAVGASGGIFFHMRGETLGQAGQGLSFTAAPDMIPGGAVIRIH